ncbi:hypothetical protein JIN85_17240 [Luteolibacter pohnpeiensis]|uniref:Uncharacterized protein n=1 Tax=Luteolibacter pohnpeiensis TaxID=454153 RepID=A0A934VXS7_9BACT|nr:hypothetical protein [Luteolibacter pohnpeiensis]MBK1884168.1 hypothetical protein [Luteolibacter pohnpeiensis]
MILSPKERKETIELAAKQLTAELRASVDIDELNLIELSTAAQLLGLSATHAAKVLPIVEVGPRSRRVTVAAYKAFIKERTIQK